MKKLMKFEGNKHKKLFNDERFCFSIGTISFLISSCATFNLIGSVFYDTIFVLISSLFSANKFKEATKYNKKIECLEKEKQILKLLKLYISYFMITLNLGLNVTNLSINCQEIERQAEETEFCLDNPFLKDDTLSVSEKTSLLMDAFKSNPFLNETDLEIALSLEEAIEDNLYINYESMYEKLATIKVLHYENTDNKNVSGSYNWEHNIVTMYKDSYSSQEQYVDTLQHEFYHSMGSLDNGLLREGMASVLQMEYSNDVTVNNSYYDHVLFARIFCELISANKMLEAYTKHDMNIIKEEMLKINSDINNYNQLIKAMDEYSEEYYDIYFMRYITSINRGYIDYENLPSHDFLSLFIPYIDSDKIDYDTKSEVMYFISNIGLWNDVNSRKYFNVGSDTDAIYYFGEVPYKKVINRN